MLRKILEVGLQLAALHSELELATYTKLTNLDRLLTSA